MSEEKDELTIQEFVTRHRKDAEALEMWLKKNMRGPRDAFGATVLYLAMHMLEYTVETGKLQTEGAVEHVAIILHGCMEECAKLMELGKKGVS
jgi:hypothetical protein